MSQGIASRDFSRLKPADSFYDVDIDALENYYRVIKKHLISAEEGWFMSRFWVLPSWEKEYFIGTKREGEEVFIIYREPEKQIWSAADTYDDYTPKIVEIKQRISKESLLSLNLLIEVAVINARFDQEIRSDKNCFEVTIGTDGTSYFFSSSIDFWPKTATIWSPRQNSVTGELIGILEEVIVLVKTRERDSIEFTPELRKKIAELTAKFRSDT